MQEPRRTTDGALPSMTPPGRAAGGAILRMPPFASARMLPTTSLAQRRRRHEFQSPALARASGHPARVVATTIGVTSPKWQAAGPATCGARCRWPMQGTCVRLPAIVLQSDMMQPSPLREIRKGVFALVGGGGGGGSWRIKLPEELLPSCTNEWLALRQLEATMRCNQQTGMPRASSDTSGSTREHTKGVASMSGGENAQHGCDALGARPHVARDGQDPQVFRTDGTRDRSVVEIVAVAWRMLVPECSA